MRIDFEDATEEAEVPMTPLIDIVFLLLIFFLVTASLRKPHVELPIELVHAGSAVKAKGTLQELIITVAQTPGGEEGKKQYVILIDGERMTEDSFQRRVAETAKKDPGTRVRLDLDRNAPAYQIIKIVDTLQFYNLNNIGVRTKD